MCAFEYKRQTGSPKLYLPVSVIVVISFVTQIVLFFSSGFSPLKTGYSVFVDWAVIFIDKDPIYAFRFCFVYALYLIFYFGGLSFIACLGRCCLYDVVPS
jgi:hypothetical protein